MTRTPERLKEIEYQLKALNLNVIPVIRDSKAPAFVTAGTNKKWFELAREQIDSDINTKEYNLGILGGNPVNLNDKIYYPMTVDFDPSPTYEMECVKYARNHKHAIEKSQSEKDEMKEAYDADMAIINDKLIPSLKGKGYLVVQSPSGGAHITFLTDKIITGSTNIYKHISCGIHVDYRTDKTMAVVADEAGQYDIIEIPEKLGTMSIDQLAVDLESIGFKSTKKTDHNGSKGLQRGYISTYLETGRPPDDIPTQDFLFAYIKYEWGLLKGQENFDKIKEKCQEMLNKFYPDSAWHDKFDDKIKAAFLDQKPLYMNPGKPGGKGFDAYAIAEELLKKQDITKDKVTEKIFITRNGFLQDVTTPMKYDISEEYKTSKYEAQEVIHSLLSIADNIPKTSNNIRFKNGVWNVETDSFDTEDDSICAIGFPQYDYKADANPEKFVDMIDNQVREDSKDNLYTWLKKLPTTSKEIRIAVFQGIPGCGKSAMASILQQALGEYGYGVNMSTYFKDRATEAGTLGKTLLYFQDTPSKWSDIDRLKQITGEFQLNVRANYKDSEITKNMLNIVVSCNSLPKIESDDEAAMFDRLALVRFNDTKIRGTSKDDEEFPLKVAKEEGEDIISYCLNLRNTLPSKFNSPDRTKHEWKEISCPEIRMLKNIFHYDKDNPGMSIHNVLEIMHERYDNADFEVKSLKKALTDLGYTASQGNYIGLTKTIIKDGQETLS